MPNDFKYKVLYCVAVILLVVVGGHLAVHFIESYNAISRLDQKIIKKCTLREEDDVLDKDRVI